MANFGGKNRIELESQILCAALRQSWADTDATGMVKSCQELSTIFPDLLPPPSPQVSNPSNYYDVLEIDCDVNTPKIIAAYFKAVKKFLRENPKPRNLKNEYYRLLNAGFILRRPRSRLSHDLIVVRGALLDSNIIPEDGTLRIVEQQYLVEPAVQALTQAVAETAAPVAEDAAETVPPPVEEPVSQTTAEPVEKPSDTVETAPVPPQEALPILVELLQHAQLIGSAEVHALQNQTKRFPDIALADLVLHSGYASVPEMKSLMLAEFLITSGKMTMPQVKAILDEKRTWMDLYYPVKEMPVM